MKRLLSIFLLFTIILFTGCGKKEDQNVITFTSWGSQSEVSVLKSVIAEFEKQNPDLKINFIHSPQNYFQKLHLLFASNMSPDVLFINNFYIPTYANFLENLNEQVDTTIFFQEAIDAVSYNNNIYAIPRDVSNLVIYYNKDIFDKMKVPYPTPDWTFDEFLATSIKLTNQNHWAINFEDTPLFYLPYLMSQGGGILSDDLKTEIINSQQSQKGLNFYVDLKNKYHVAPTNSEKGSATTAQLFIQGKLAMHLSGRWLVPKYRETLPFNWDIINFPNGDNGSVVSLDASGWAIAKSSKNKTNALRFIKFLSSKESIEKFTESGLITPARIDVANSEIFLSGTPKSSHIFIDVIKKSKKTPVSVGYQELTDKLCKKLEPIFE